MCTRNVSRILLLGGLVLAFGMANEAPSRGQARTYQAIAFVRPTPPIFATDVAECAEYRSEWQEILDQIQSESLACAGANALAGHDTPINSCVANFPEVLNVGGCRTYRSCKAIDEQFWSTLLLIDEESKQCIDGVSMKKMLAREKPSESEEELASDLLEGSRSVKQLRRLIQGLSGPDPHKAIWDSLIKFSASVPRRIGNASRDASRTVVTNALDEYVKAMEAASAATAATAAAAKEAAARRPLIEAPTQRIVEPVYLPKAALLAGPDRLTGDVKLTCGWGTIIFKPGGQVEIVNGFAGAASMSWALDNLPSGPKVMLEHFMTSGGGRAMIDSVDFQCQ